MRLNLNCQKQSLFQISKPWKLEVIVNISLQIVKLFDTAKKIKNTVVLFRPE